MAKDRVILITGSTDGLGRRVAEKLAAPGLHLLVHGRDAGRGKSVTEAVARAGGSARFYQADFAALSEVRRLAETVQAEHTQLDALVNNAGIGTGGPRKQSADGFELHFAVNYLAPFLLTRLLQPLLSTASAARIVNVASAGQQAIDFGDVMLERGYDDTRAYCQSKLAQVMDTFDLAEDLKATEVTANCLHPATYMDTTMVRDAGIRPINSVDTGADAVLALLCEDAFKSTSGRYFDVQREARASAQAYDPEARSKLRSLSLKLTGLER